MIEIDPETTLDKVKILVKIDAVITIEGMGTYKISAEIMAEVEAEILTETIAATEGDQKKEGYHLEGTIVIITDKTQILEYGLNLEDQGPEVDPTQIMQLYKLWPQKLNQIICMILKDTGKIQNI